jgi:hypothetical protein
LRRSVQHHTPDEAINCRITNGSKDWSKPAFVLKNE